METESPSPPPSATPPQPDAVQAAPALDVIPPISPATQPQALPQEPPSVNPPLSSLEPVKNQLGDQPEQRAQDTKPQAPAKTRKPHVATAMAATVIIVLGLALIAVYAYMHQSK